MNCNLKDRKSEIQLWIKDRLSNKETRHCYMECGLRGSHHLRSRAFIHIISSYGEMNG